MKYSRDELSEMPLNRLRGIDIQTKEEEDLVQEIIGIKLQNLPPETNIFIGDISTDNMTPEKEAEMQKKIDERTRKAKGIKNTDELINEAEQKLEEIQNEVVEVSQEATGSPTANDNVEVEQVVKVEKDDGTKPFCECCDSKGVRHKSNCTRVK